MTTRPVALVIMHETDNSAALVGERLAERGYVLREHVVTPDYDASNVANSWPSLDDVSLLVLMGSVRSLPRKHEIDSWVHDELVLIREAHASGLPILGVCFGGQLISEALGGDVEVAPVTEIGWVEIEGDENPVGSGPWFEWHHDRFTPPPGATVLARSEHAVQLFTIGRALGTQFHPEVTEAHVKNWTEVCEPGYLAEYGVDGDVLVAETGANEAHNRDQCALLVDWFLDNVAAS